MRSQDKAALASVDAAGSPWRTRQALFGADDARCVRQNVKSRVRSVVSANETCVALRPQFGKQPLRSHRATQKSLPALLRGGRSSRRIRRVPPGATVMFANSVSGAGLSTR